MDFIFQPWQLLMIIIAGWINRQQQEVIDYHRAEIKVLRQKLGKGRILLNDDQRRVLAIKGKVLGRKRLNEVGTLFTPDTILRWHHCDGIDYWSRKSGITASSVNQWVDPGYLQRLSSL